MGHYHHTALLHYLDLQCTWLPLLSAHTFHLAKRVTLTGLYIYKLSSITGTIQTLTEECKCDDFMDLPSDSGETDFINQSLNTEKSFIDDKSLKLHQTNSNNSRTFEQNKVNLNRHHIISRRMEKKENPQDAVFKGIINGLVKQSLLDNNRSLHSLDNIRNRIKNEVTYQIGFITRFIKHQRDLMNDFFDLAIKNRHNVLILQQMNVFEHIMHTNVNITNLVNRLVSIHIKHKNRMKQKVPDHPLLPKEGEHTNKTNTTLPIARRRLFPSHTHQTSRKPPYIFYQQLKEP